jgi:hypothetical protein
MCCVYGSCACTCETSWVVMVYTKVWSGFVDGVMMKDNAGYEERSLFAGSHASLDRSL